MQKKEEIYNQKINKLIEGDPEVTQVLDLAGKNMKMVIITVLYMNPKISGDTEDIKKINQISTDENYNVLRRNIQWLEVMEDQLFQTRLGAFRVVWPQMKIRYFRRNQQ